MVNRLTLTKRRTLGVIFVCTVLIAGFTMWWQTGHVAEAAVLEPHPDLVGWWRLDEESGSVAGDSSGNENNGTVYGATWVDGKYGKALSFDGIDDYVDCGAMDVIETNVVTLMMWMYRNVNPAGPRIICDKGTASGLSFEEIPGGTVLSYIHNAGMQSFGVIPINTWTHLVMTADGVNKKIYKNGVLLDTIAFNQAITDGNFSLGGRASTLNFNGIIDEVRVYNRALSAAEIQESFQKRPNFSSKLLAKVPKGTTQVTATLTWQGIGTINVTMESPSKSYTEDIVPVYQKTVYSTSSGTSDMLNIKRLSISVSALSSDENWYVILEFDDAEDYRITVEIQR